MLSKSEKKGLEVELDDKLASLSHFLKFYTQDRYTKGYAGASAKFLASLAKFAARDGQCLILNAREDNEIVASILVFTHGQGATYQADGPHHMDGINRHIICCYGRRYKF